MKFVTGLLAGVAIGAVGVVAYSVQSGRDLREGFEGIRADLRKGDFDALGSRLDAGFAHLQAQIETKTSQVLETATATADGAAGTAAAAAGGAAEATADAATTVVEEIAPEG